MLACSNARVYLASKFLCACEPHSDLIFDIANVGIFTLNTRRYLEYVNLVVIEYLVYLYNK